MRQTILESFVELLKKRKSVKTLFYDMAALVLIPAVVILALAIGVFLFWIGAG